MDAGTASGAGAARIIALEGPSGVGKSSVARALAVALGAERIPEAFERIEPTPSLRFDDHRALAALELRLLAEEARRHREAEALRALGRTVVLDTGVLGPLTYSAGCAADRPELVRALAPLVRAAVRLTRAGRLGLPTAVVYLDLPPGPVRSRLTGDPIGHPFALRARHARVGRFERRFWLEGYRAVAPARLFVVHATGPAAGIARELADRAVPRMPRGAPPRRALLRLLSELPRSPREPVGRPPPESPRRPGPTTGNGPARSSGKR